MSIQKYDKLVRDKVLAKIRADNCTPHFRPAKDNEEKKRYVGKKLVEEANEVRLAKTRSTRIGELADLCQLIIEAALLDDITIEEIEIERIRKIEKSGGFKDWIILHSIEIPEGRP